jgi:hypothetical protein
MSEHFSENIVDLSLDDRFPEISEEESKSNEEFIDTFGKAYQNIFSSNKSEDFKIDENFYYYTKDALDPNSAKSLSRMKETNSETKKGLLVVNKSPLAFDKSFSIMEKIHANESYKDQNSCLNEKCFNELNSSEDKLDTK